MGQKKCFNGPNVAPVRVSDQRKQLVGVGDSQEVHKRVNNLTGDESDDGRRRRRFRV